MPRTPPPRFPEPLLSPIQGIGRQGCVAAIRGPQERVKPPGRTVWQSQADAEGVDLAPRVNTILFTRIICYIRLEQAGGHGGQQPPLLAPPLPYCLLHSSFAASFNPMTPDTKPSLRFSCQGPQTPCSRRQPSLRAGPSEAGVHTKRHFVCARKTGHCNLLCGFFGQERLGKGPLLSFAFSRFYFFLPCNVFLFPKPLISSFFFLFKVFLYLDRGRFSPPPSPFPFFYFPLLKWVATTQILKVV